MAWPLKNLKTEDSNIIAIAPYATDQNKIDPCTTDQNGIVLYTTDPMHNRIDQNGIDPHATDQ
jgi:hypothetical protein